MSSGKGVYGFLELAGIIKLLPFFAIRSLSIELMRSKVVALYIYNLSNLLALYK